MKNLPPDAALHSYWGPEAELLAQTVEALDVIHRQDVMFRAQKELPPVRVPRPPAIEARREAKRERPAKRTTVAHFLDVFGKLGAPTSGGPDAGTG